MFRLFLPLYLLIFIFIFFSDKLYNYAIEQYAIDYYTEDKRADYQSLFFIMDALSPHISHKAYKELLTTANKTSNIPIHLLTWDEIKVTKEGIAALQQGEIWFADIGEQILLKPLKNTEYVVRVGPMHTIDELVERDRWISSTISISFILLIILWALNLQRKLYLLNNATLRFGQGQLHTRATTAIFQRVGMLNHTFNQMAQRVEELIQSHKNLTNAVSHELRTPIARLAFELESLRIESTPEELEQLIADMAEDVDELDSLVDELLHYAKFERVDLQLDFELISLEKWLQNWQIHHRSHAVIQLEIKPCSTHYTVPIAPESLSRAVDNLVLNAYRYAKTKVIISTEYKKDDVFLHIDDDGIGIPLANREQIFEPFVRVDKSRNRKTGGFGLGLSIVREIIRRHGGSVSNTDSPLGGARFTLFWSRNKK